MNELFRCTKDMTAIDAKKSNRIPNDDDILELKGILKDFKVKFNKEDLVFGSMRELNKFRKESIKSKLDSMV